MNRVRLVSVLAAVSAFSVLAACSDPPPKPKVADQQDVEEQARIAKGREAIDRANEAISEKSYKAARRHLADAQKLGVESQRFEIEEALEKIDKREAKAIAKAEDEKLKAKDCPGAFAALAKASRERNSDAFTRELRAVAADDAVKCEQAYCDDALLAQRYADARALVDGADAKEVLGATVQEKQRRELDAAIEDALRAQLAEQLKAKKWDQAVARIDAWVKKGDANDEQGKHLLDAVRKGETPEIQAILAKAIGAPNAEKAMKDVDARVALLRWELVPPAEIELKKDTAMPEDVAKGYRALATWVEAQRVHMKPLKKAEKRFALGKIAVSKPTKIDEDAKRDVLHGAEVFVIGATKDKALVSEKDPGAAPLTDLLDGALGWVPIERLKKEPTIDWVVPDDQLKGERVWAPMRGDSSYELGTVVDVGKGDVSVKRAADDQIIKVARAKLRSGRLAPGTRVLTFCTAKDQPAKIMEVLPTGAAKLKCDGGQEKEEVFASLRSTADLLPPTK